LRYDKIGAAVNLGFQIFDLFIFTEYTPCMAIWVSWWWVDVRCRNMSVAIKMTCHPERESIGELWWRSDVRDKIQTVVETGICGDPVFFSSWWI
jgi:hypothetical protein